jgi:hypothetical protein
MEADVSEQVGSTRRRKVMAAVVVAIAAFIAVASAVQAVRQDSWAPIWSVGWLPAVCVASLWIPSRGRDCRPRLRRLSGR